MIERLNDSGKNVSVNLDKFQKLNQNSLEDIRGSIESLKANAFCYAYDSNQKSDDKKIVNRVQKESVEKCLSNLNNLTDLNESFNDMIGELKFFPNIDMPSKSIIGNLKHVKQINLKEQFKTIKSQQQISKLLSIEGSSQKFPISPRFLCIPDPYYLFVTDSQTKHLLQLTLETGDFVRSTNLNGQFRNPDGICVNPKTGHIYISDADLKIIFKLDSKFNLLKKFGQKDLKWPRGLAYDADPNDSNPNRLYVCDYSNQKISIYNEHDQLRDCIVISFIDELIPKFNKNHSDHSSSLYPDQKNELDDEFKFCPLNIFLTKKYIYVTDDWTGGNCVRIFDKSTHRLLRNVGDLNVWNPLGLIVDDIGNIFTIGRLYYETGSTHLFCFSKEGELLYKTNLNINSDWVGDFVVDKYTDKSNHRLLCAGDKRINIFQF